MEPEVKEAFPSGLELKNQKMLKKNASGDESRCTIPNKRALEENRENFRQPIHSRHHENKKPWTLPSAKIPPSRFLRKAFLLKVF